METIPNEQLIKLIEAGIQAPSADNGQPWKFKLMEDGFELWLDKANMGLFFDVNKIATQISCGAVIENIITYANNLGLKTNITYFDEPSNKFAKLTFTHSGSTKANEDKVRQSLFNRHSDRNLYQFNKKIPDTLIAALINSVQFDEGHRLHLYQEPKARKAIIKTITATDTIRFIHKQVHNDFYKVLRFGSSAQQTKDGLASATLGIESFMIPILQLLKPWKLTQLLNLIGLHHIMALRGTWLPMKSASLIVSITHKGTANYVESGRIMQRFWIQANEAGLSVQALGALPLFLARCHQAHGDGFSPAQLKKLSILENDFSSISPTFDYKNDQLIMLFRLGYTNQPTAKSYRRVTESFFM